MTKKTYPSTNLFCTLQHDKEISEDKCHVGIISKTAGGFLFEEAIRKGRPPRNPKLFDGKYISMVRLKNGRYQMHLKTMDSVLDREKYAFGVYSEVSSALKMMADERL